jgi:DNA-binding CsgD family transcriptional regulator/PAS domain-containing protein
MITDDDIDRQIAEIAELAFTDEPWAQIFPIVTRSVNARWGGLVAQEPGTGLASIRASTGLSPAMRTAYETYYGPRSLTWRNATAALPVGQVFADHQYHDYRAYLRSEVYNDYFRPLGGDHLLTTKLLQVPGRRADAFVSLRRSARDGRFQPAEMRWLARVAPHLTQVLRVQALLAARQAAQATSGALLDLLPNGVFLVDREARVLEMNRAAHALLTAADGLLLQQGRLAAASTADTRRLRRLVAQADDQQRGMDDAPGLALARPSGRRGYQVLVATLPAAAAEDRFDVALRRPAVAVFVDDPAVRPAPPLQALQRLYQLTPAEARLAAKLATGISLQQAADEIGIAKETARGYLKRIFGKTATSRQGELVRLLAARTWTGESEVS